MNEINGLNQVEIVTILQTALAPAFLLVALGAMLGLSASWSRDAIAVSGNYGEIFAKNIGEETPIGLARGLNAQWTDGGLIYSPPFR